MSNCAVSPHDFLIGAVSSSKVSEGFCGMAQNAAALLSDSVCPVKVLIVEDEFIVAANLHETLIKLGYTVTELAASAAEALYQVEVDRPDVVLMAIQLRGSLDGIETTTLLWYTYQLPVIYMLGYSDSATLARVEASPAFGYLVKPVKEAELVNAINGAYLSMQAQPS